VKSSVLENFYAKIVQNQKSFQEPKTAESYLMTEKLFE
jgi:hypothetical protein